VFEQTDRHAEEENPDVPHADSLPQYAWQVAVAEFEFEEQAVEVKAGVPRVRKSVASDSRIMGTSRVTRSYRGGTRSNDGAERGAHEQSGLG
jgi:hypothetical protein